MVDNDDNLSPLITQCPNCDARFRVTESQLQVARGRVRCGACLSVFDATAQLLMDGERLSGTPDTDDVDALLDELSGDDDASMAAAPDSVVVPHSKGETATSGLASDQPFDQQNRGQQGVADAEQEHEIPAELLALEAALLDELKETGGGGGRAKPDTDSDSVMAKAEVAEADALVSEDASEWVGDLDENAWSEPEVAISDAQGPANASANSDDAKSQDLEVPHLSEVDQEAVDQEAGDQEAGDQEAGDLEAIEEPAIAVEEAAATAVDAVAPKGPGRDVRRGFEDLRIPEPAVFDEAELPPRRSWMTLALIGIAVVALPAQVLWFQFDSWAKDERYRPMYGAICSVLGCDLPVMRDLTKLERREFHMRHHPESDNAYVFDLLIVNVADFPQPYPVIELIASTERGSLVAGRRFKPEEYLHGEVRPTDLLPPRTPVHISLEIEHPGHPNLEFQTRFR